MVNLKAKIKKTDAIFEQIFLVGTNRYKPVQFYLFQRCGNQNSGSFYQIKQRTFIF